MAADREPAPDRRRDAVLICAHCRKPTAVRKGRNDAGDFVNCAWHHKDPETGKRCVGCDMEVVRGDPPAPKPRRSSEHSAALDRLVGWFEEHQLPTPGRGAKADYGVLGMWLNECGGQAGDGPSWPPAADRAVSILKHCRGADKLNGSGRWGYVMTLMEAHGATGIQRGNGRAATRHPIEPWESEPDRVALAAELQSRLEAGDIPPEAAAEARAKIEELRT